MLDSEDLPTGMGAVLQLCEESEGGRFGSLAQNRGQTWANRGAHGVDVGRDPDAGGDQAHLL